MIDPRFHEHRIRALVGHAHVHAGVVIQGTRVVYPANEREVVVRMTNERAYPVLVEAWIDRPEDASTTQPVPFALTPPLFRLDAAKGQTLRIFQSPGAVPTDREVLYYLNVRVHNPTPYFVTVTALEPEGGKAQPLTGVMVAPFSDLSIPLDAGTLPAARKFHYTILNDLGGAVRLPGTVGGSP